MKNLTVYFVRHGQTYYNLMSKMQGWSDAPLTDKGISMLEKTALGLANKHFDAFYSSDLKRAMDTAEIIIAENIATFPKLELQLDSNFREVGFGIFEGIDDSEVAKIIGEPYGFETFDDFNNIDQIRDATKEADSSGFAEDANDVYRRMENGMKDLLEQNEDGSHILVVTHGGFIRMMAERYGITGPHNKVIELPTNGSVTKVTLTPDEVKIIDFARPNDQL